MSEKIVVGPISKGLRNDVTPFNIDNDSFPTLVNAYQWRGRIKRKRGTSFLGRLTRYFNSNSTSYTSTASFNLVAGAGNLLTGFGLQANGNIVPGSVIITVGANTYTDPAEDGILVGAPGGSGTINYGTGAITIAGGGAGAVSGSFIYYPNLPVMGLEDLNLNATQYPGTIAFDTTYSYSIQNAFPFPIYDVSFYKNPTTGTYTAYVEKTNVTPLTWNGEDYQQFWSTNYEAALWVTNGIEVPFTVTNIGMHYNTITAIAIGAGGPPAVITITTLTNHGLVIGDFVFLNEINGIDGINFQTGYVTAVPAVNQITVTLPNATLVGAFAGGGIVQYLTSRSDNTKDCIRWYDGDPTNGDATTPILNGHKGWVNFCPPLSKDNYSIADLPLAKYYLVGARMIVPFKDRLLFIGPVVQTSAEGSQKYLQDTIIYSQNGTPYYTASFTGDPSLITTVFNPILVPDNKTAVPGTFWGDQAGFGGWISAGVDQPIITVGSNEDVLIIGFNNIQARLVYSGNDIIPFNFYLTNSELGSSSTFSVVNMDQGVITRGDRGIVISGQTQVQRIDLQIPDEVFQLNLTNNGAERFCSQRDFINEWIYFTYPVNKIVYKFPTQTLLYNYRDQTWAIFRETYTTYGSFRKQTGFTWQTVGSIFPTWNDWNEPWNAGSSTLLNPLVIAGNQQGFILVRDDGTGEGDSLQIQSLSGNTVTSPNHCLNPSDYIVISGAIGTIGNIINDQIFLVYDVTTNTFKIDNPNIPSYVGTYVGGGVIKRMYIPYIQTKEFIPAWALARKVRIGAQRYLLTRTPSGQLTLLIFLSQNQSSPYNNSPIVPEIGSVNNALIYSTLLFTSPEGINLGLTPTGGLQTPTARQQDQIWHRVNTSLVGDSVMLGFTLNDTQMRDTSFSNQFSEIELHGFMMDVAPSQLLV